MAKALYLRGVAYRQQGKPAQAISDLTSALWLKGGLADSDRADAIKQRTAAYGDAGLTETGEAVAAAPAAKERQASTKGWGATTSPDEGSSSSAPARRQLVQGLVQRLAEQQLFAERSAAKGNDGLDPEGDGAALPLHHRQPPRQRA